jgi:hypothetical protein
MRIAVHPQAEPGLRAARIILGERQLAELGMFRRSLNNPDDPRARPIDDLAGFDVLVSDDVDDPFAIAHDALEAGVSCVLWSDLWEDRAAARALGDQFAAAGLTLLVGASLGSGIASALASHEVARTEETLELTVAWTIEGRPLRRGEPLPFPDPVGSRWGREVEDQDLPAPRPTRHFVAPITGDWAGAMARITGVLDDGVARRVVGVADHAGHLEGIAIAAATFTVATGAYRPGLQWPSTHEEYLEKALTAGLAVATFTVEESSRERG